MPLASKNVVNTNADHFMNKHTYTLFKKHFPLMSYGI